MFWCIYKDVQTYEAAPNFGAISKRCLDNSIFQLSGCSGVCQFHQGGTMALRAACSAIDAKLASVIICSRSSPKMRTTTYKIHSGGAVPWLLFLSGVCFWLPCSHTFSGLDWMSWGTSMSFGYLMLFKSIYTYLLVGKKWRNHQQQRKHKRVICYW